MRDHAKRRKFVLTTYGPFSRGRSPVCRNPSALRRRPSALCRNPSALRRKPSAPHGALSSPRSSALMRRPSALVQSSSALSRRPSAQERSRLMATAPRTWGAGSGYYFVRMRKSCVGPRWLKHCYCFRCFWWWRLSVRLLLMSHSWARLWLTIPMWTSV